MKLDDARLYVEHGWLCARNETGWLIHKIKIADAGTRDILPEIRAAIRLKPKPERDEC